MLRKRTVFFFFTTISGLLRRKNNHFTINSWKIQQLAGASAAQPASGGAHRNGSTPVPIMRTNQDGEGEGSPASNRCNIISYRGGKNTPVWTRV